MRFLVDECTGTSVVAYLRSAGHDAVAVVDVLPEADDEDISGLRGGRGTNCGDQ